VIDDVGNPRPCSPAEAVQRALSLVNNGGEYQLGTGDYQPVMRGGRMIDLPWTQRGEAVGCDCAGFAISWCYKLRRHRPGFNHGDWASVEDDLNSNSAIEDAEHRRELFAIADRPMPGDLLAYPTIHLPGHPQPFIGHVGIVVAVNRCAEWDPAMPQYHLLDVAQVCGPNGRRPACVRTDGSVWDRHTANWPKMEHRTKVLRALP